MNSSFIFYYYYHHSSFIIIIIHNNNNDNNNNNNNKSRLLLTNRSFRFLVRLKAFGSGLLKILLVVLSSRRIRKFVEMILPASRFMGWKVLTDGTLSLALLLAPSIFKISALDLVDACSFSLLMGSFG